MQNCTGLLSNERAICTKIRIPNGLADIVHFTSHTPPFKSEQPLMPSERNIFVQDLFTVFPSVFLGFAMFFSSFAYISFSSVSVSARPIALVQTFSTPCFSSIPSSATSVFPIGSVPGTFLPCLPSHLQISPVQGRQGGETVRVDDHFRTS